MFSYFDPLHVFLINLQVFLSCYSYDRYSKAYLYSQVLLSCINFQLNVFFFFFNINIVLYLSGGIEIVNFFYINLKRVLLAKGQQKPLCFYFL